MANRDIVTIGTFAGGFEALLSGEGVSSEFPASILVTVHLPLQFHSSLDEMLTRAGPLPATFVSEAEVSRQGRIYIAVPGRHLIVDGERLSLGTAPRGITPADRSNAAFHCGMLR